MPWGDISVTNGAASDLVANADEATYTATITPTAEGTVGVSVAANAATDKDSETNRSTKKDNKAASKSVEYFALVDYDTDDDGLIEISSWAQLEAIRWDLSGDGKPIGGFEAKYEAGFPRAMSGMGCPTGGCAGYELTVDLDFDTNDDGAVTSSDDYWNDGKGWIPLEGQYRPNREIGQSGTFEGNGHTIRNLYMRSTEGDDLGLFYDVYGTVKNLALVDVDIETDGASAGDVVGNYKGVSPLVGTADGSIYASYTMGNAKNDYGTWGAGGLIGSWALNLDNAEVEASYTTARSTGGSTDSPLVGDGAGGGFVVRNSYWDTLATHVSSGFGGTPKTPSELTAPTGYTGIYANWNLDLDGDSDTDDNPWQFGRDSDYSYLSWQDSPPPAPYLGIDYDADDDGLIEFASLAQLNAIRWDVDGNGKPGDEGFKGADEDAYLADFPEPALNMGCPESDCDGYELTADLGML